MAVFIGVALILILAVLAIRERRKAAQYDFSQLPAQHWQLTEYTGNGQHRDYYAPFSGRDLDSHERAHYEQAMIYRAAELAHQRRSGRWEGRRITVEWTPGLDGETDNLARWLQEHGSAYGVYISQK